MNFVIAFGVALLLVRGLLRALERGQLSSAAQVALVDLAGALLLVLLL